MTRRSIDPFRSPLLTDLYQLTMLEACFEHEVTGTAVFEFFVRRLPPQRGFLLAAGLEQAVEFLERLCFSEDDLEWIRASGRFGTDFAGRLKGLRFTGDADALPEGTVFFANEPLLRVVAPMAEAQLAETRLINILHFQSLIACKAARCALAAPGKTLVEFGLRRAHGAEAGMFAARASFIAGFAGTSNVAAAAAYGIPVFGTMAHSFVQAHDREELAFEHFALAQPRDVTLLIDTFDTEVAAGKVVRLAPRLRERGIRIGAVRLDSGDSGEHARQVRRILDDGGLADVRIFSSGNLDEYALLDLVARGAPIDGFGIGTHLDTSADAPYLDCAYKLTEYDGRPRRKRSEGKATLPGRKQVFRRYAPSGEMAGDVLTLEGDRQEGEPLLRPVIRAGRRVSPQESLEAARRRAHDQMERLPARLRRLETEPPYAVTVAAPLSRLADEVDRQTRRG